MSKKPIIVLNVTLDYLAFPSFSTLIKNLTSFDFFLINIIENKTLLNKDPLKYPNYKNLIEETTYKIAPPFSKSIGIISKIKNFPKNLDRYKSLKKLVHQKLDEVQPDLIIATSDKGYGDRITQIWAKKNSIRFVILQPSFIDGSLQTARVSWKERAIYRAKFILLNKILRVPVYRKNELYGYERKDNLVFLWSEHFLLGSKTENIKFTGLPAFDELFRNFNSVREIKNTILISSEIFEEIFDKELSEQIYIIYNGIIKNKTDCKFIIKAHPRESSDKIKEMYSDFADRVEIVSDISLYELFPKVDLSISVNSFSAVEAAAYGVPVLNIVPPEAQSLIKGYFDFNLSQEASSAAEAIEKINEVFTEDYWSKFLKNRKLYFDEYFLSTEGTSVELIRKIIKNELG